MAVNFNGSRVTHITSTTTLGGKPSGTLFWQYGDGFISADKTQLLTNAQVLTALGNGDAMEYSQPAAEWSTGRLRKSSFETARDYVLLDKSKITKPAQSILDELQIESTIYQEFVGNDGKTYILVSEAALYDETGGKLVKPKLNGLRAAFVAENVDAVKAKQKELIVADISVKGIANVR